MGPITHPFYYPFVWHFLAEKLQIKHQNMQHQDINAPLIGGDGIKDVRYPVHISLIYIGYPYCKRVFINF